MFASPHPDHIITSSCRKANSVTFNYSNKQTASVHKPRRHSAACQQIPEVIPEALFFFCSEAKHFYQRQITMQWFSCCWQTHIPPQGFPTDQHLHILQPHFRYHHPGDSSCRFHLSRDGDGVEKPRWLQLFSLPACLLLIRLRSY